MMNNQNSLDFVKFIYPLAVGMPHRLRLGVYFELQIA